MRKTRIFGQKFSVLGIGNGGGGSLPPKIINVPADYPTLIEANKNMGRHYYIGGTPSVTDNDPTKTNTGQTFLLGQDIMWDGISAYFKVGDNAIWSDNESAVKTINPRNLDMQGKGFKNTNLWTTIGASGADYTSIQAAINAGKYNLRIIGDFTEADPGGINTGANFVQIFIAERLQLSNTNFTIGTGGIKVRGGIIAPTYTGAILKIFKSSVLATLNLADVTFFMNAATAANSGIADMLTGSKHLVHNCNFALSNTAECGFKNAGDSSSFTGLNVIGGGAACEGFIPDAKGAIISDINISGTVKDISTFISSGAGTVPCVINDIRFTGTNRPIIGLKADANQVNNINGDIELDVTDTALNQISNCYIADLDLSDANANRNQFTNVVVTTDAVSIDGDENIFVNCKFTPAVTLAAGSNNNQLLLCKSTGGFIDSGTDNAIIEAISGDETLSADSKRLLCDQHSIKTYADNIAKGITVDYYFSNEPDVAIPDYDIMFPADTGEVESTAAAALPAADTLIQPFVTQTTEPNFTTLLAGNYDIHIHAAKTAGTKDVFIYAKFYKRTYPGGVETLLSTSDNSALLTSGNVGYTLHFSLLNDEILNDTDRLVVKFFGTPSGVGTDPTATLYLEGTNASRMDIHTTTSSWMLNLQNIIYVNGAGNDSNDGKNMGTPKLTLAAAITAAIAQSPSASNMITIKDLGGARLDEDITLPSWCILDTCDAHVVGQVTLGVTMAADSHFYFNKASPESGSECIRISGTGTRYIRGNSTAGALNSTFIVAGGGAVVYLDVVNANAVATGAKFSSLTTGAVLFLKAQTFRETVASTSSGATVFRNVVDDGSNADTSSINETGNHIIRGKDKVSLGTAAVPSVVDIEGVGAKWITTPSFVANLTSDDDDVTGDGTTYTVICDNEVANIGSHYNSITGAFTAPTTGLYQFDIVTLMKGFTSAHMLSIYLNVSVGTPQNWLLFDVNAANVRTGTPYYIALTACTTVKLNSGDVVKANINVRGGTKVVDVTTGTKFSGRLITKL